MKLGPNIITNACTNMNKKQELSQPSYRGGLLFLVLPAVTEEEDSSISTAEVASLTSLELLTDADLAVVLLFPLPAVGFLLEIFEGFALLFFAVAPAGEPSTGCESSEEGFCEWIALLSVTCRPNFLRLLSETTGSSSCSSSYIIYTIMQFKTHSIFQIRFWNTH